MNETILVGRGPDVFEVPGEELETSLSQIPERFEERLRFMSEEHRRVRYFVARELPRVGVPIEPELIARGLNLPLQRASELLQELEHRLFFLVRNETGNVSWAFPVTVDRTPHYLAFSTGERLHGAWAEDAFVAPFVQGRLRQQNLSIRINTECAHCRHPLHIEVDSEMNYRVEEADAEPLIFEPQVDWKTFEESNIIHAYWTNSVFLWSEEHAREYRRQSRQVDGTYLTLKQSARSSRIAQAALFEFE